MAIIVLREDQACWVYEAKHVSYESIDDEGYRHTMPQQFHFNDIAQGAGVIIFDAWKSGVVAVLDIPPVDVDEITFDETELGSVEFKFRGPDGKRLLGAKVGLALPDIAETRGHLIEYFDPSQPERFEGSIYSPSPGGGVTISGLGAGSYQLGLVSGETQSSFAFQVKAKEHQSIELQLGADGQLSR